LVSIAEMALDDLVVYRIDDKLVPSPDSTIHRDVDHHRSQRAERPVRSDDCPHLPSLAATSRKERGIAGRHDEIVAGYVLPLDGNGS